MIKLLGIILISSSVAIYGSILSQKYKKRILQRGRILEFLGHIKNGIKYSSATLDELYKSFGGNPLKECLELDKEELSVISKTFSAFGKSKSARDELMLIEKAEHELLSLFDKSDREDKARALLYRKLSIIISLMLAIILL